jgi:hypothetical protein
MRSVATGICAVTGVLALVLFHTLRISLNRRTRFRSRELTSRVLNWK